MCLVVETSLLIEKCRRELVRLNELAGDFKTANEISRGFLTGANKMDVAESAADRPSCESLFKPDAQEWRERAAQTRTFAEFVILPQAKLLLLDIAEGYDRMAE